MQRPPSPKSFVILPPPASPPHATIYTSNALIVSPTKTQVTQTNHKRARKHSSTTLNKKQHLYQDAPHIQDSHHLVGYSPCVSQDVGQEELKIPHIGAGYMSS